MLKNVFRLSIIVMLTAAAVVAITPVLSINNLIFPIRIDSAYVSQQHFIYDKNSSERKSNPGESFIYTPSQLNINYIDLNLPTTDGTILRGWLAIDTTKLKSPLLFIVPDITEGAVTYIPALKQFCDRGFNVCVMNMRGQGNSNGDYYAPGKKSASDVIYLCNEIKKMPFIDRVIVMGSGTGAGIVLKAIHDSAFADVIILQNPILNFRNYLKLNAVKKWGSWVEPIMPAIERSYVKKTGLIVSEYNFIKLIQDINLPQMMVASNFFETRTLNETKMLYNFSNSPSKKLYINASSYQEKSKIENNKMYYDKISAFINSSLPKKDKKSRFKKLANLNLAQ